MGLQRSWGRGLPPLLPRPHSPAGEELGHSQEHWAGGPPRVLWVMRRPLMRVDHGERPKCCSLSVTPLGPIFALAGLEG